MESKPKKVQVRKAHKATPVPQEPPKPRDKKSIDSLILHNGELVEKLLASEVWAEIILPLIHESIAGVSGRFTNGRFYKGDLTRGICNLERISGYQCALEEFHNRINDFVVIKDKMIEDKKRDKEEAKQPMVNPFLEEE
jgi:hypothetical protein